MKVIIDYEIHRTVTVDMEKADYVSDLFNRHGEEYFADVVLEDITRDRPGIEIKDNYCIEGFSITN